MANTIKWNISFALNIILLIGIALFIRFGEKPPLRYYKPNAILITLDEEFTEIEREAILNALNQYDEFIAKEIKYKTVKHKLKNVTITKGKLKFLGENEYKIRNNKIIGSFIIIDINKMKVFADVQSKFYGTNFNDVYQNYILSVVLHEFGHTLGLKDIYDDKYMFKSIMYFDNMGLLELTDYDKGMLRSLK